ncbi:Ktr system potassium uptake protein A [Lactobacillus helveticus]|nr:Ktr system potassium uptake protein A [Lactobacillus helveticus]
MANLHQQQSFAVLGLGKFGMALTMALLQADQDVLVIDSNEEVVNDVAHLVTHAVIALLTLLTKMNCVTSILALLIMFSSLWVKMWKAVLSLLC